MLWGISLPFCTFAGWLFVLMDSRDAPVPAGVLAGFFLLIGITMLAGTIGLTLDYLKFGAVRVRLQGKPPAVGTWLDAVIELPAKAAAPWIGVELVCVRVTHEYIGGNRAASFEQDCWSEKRQFPVRRRSGRRMAVVRFDIPDTLFPSGDPGAVGAPGSRNSERDYHVWQLRIVADFKGEDFRRTLGVRVLPSTAGAGHDGRQA